MYSSFSLAFRVPRPPPKHPTICRLNGNAADARDAPHASVIEQSSAKSASRMRFANRALHRSFKRADTEAKHTVESAVDQRDVGPY